MRGRVILIIFISVGILLTLIIRGGIMAGGTRAKTDKFSRQIEFLDEGKEYAKSITFEYELFKGDTQEYFIPQINTNSTINVECNYSIAVGKIVMYLKNISGKQVYYNEFEESDNKNISIDLQPDTYKLILIFKKGKGMGSFNWEVK